MPDFKHRSSKKELLDGKDIPFDAIKQNMEELDRINTYLGGHAISWEGVKKLVGKGSKKEALHIAEIGCGGGDNLRYIQKRAAGAGLDIQLTGIDLNPECIRFAGERNKDIHFLCSDYHDIHFDKKPDIIFSSLFCHHFSDAELVEQLQWMKSNTSLGCFINDLHRHPLAYHSIRLLTKIFSNSYLVKNDAPLSVLRGFSSKEWKDIFTRAGISEYALQWRWAFRWLIHFKH